jgi:RNA polymerase sigma-70 factor (sigma-E family)
VTIGRDEVASGADAALFDDFVRNDSPALLRVAWGLTGNRAGAEDLVQSTLERVWTHWGHVREKDRAGAYARRVIVSIFLTARRRRWWGEHVTAALPDRGIDDEADVVAARRVVVAALARLPARQRVVVVLRYLDDRSEAQTAEALGCSTGTVKSHAARAMTALRHSSDLVGLWTPSMEGDDSCG